MHKNSSKDKQNCRCLSIAAFLLLSTRFVMMKSRELHISSFVKISNCFLELYLFTFSYLPIISYLIIHCFCFLFLEFTPIHFYFLCCSIQDFRWEKGTFLPSPCFCYTSPNQIVFYLFKYTFKENSLTKFLDNTRSSHKVFVKAW